MRRHYIISILMLACLFAMAANAIKAQSDRRLVIRIPFEFVLAGRVVPAGKYSVERPDATKPNVLMFRNLDNGIIRLIITQRVENHCVSTASYLTFRRIKGESQLIQVWVVGNMDGNQLPVTEGRREHQGASTLVQLKVENERP